MVTQAIKRWLYKLFPWWPWKQPPESGYAQTISHLSQGQEPVWRTTGENSLPQPGMASVIVENGREENTPETSRSTIDERSDRVTQVKPPTAEENASTSLTSSSSKESPLAKEDIPPPSPTQEQQLAFLHYLVKRGLINEGFAEGQEPEQYRQKH